MTLQFHEELGLQTQLALPEPDEFEICLFGRGIGECIVVHLGEHKFLIVDSFLRSKSKIPIALEYLQDIGLGPEHVEAILVSHWHDDHIKGASELVRRCTGSRIYIPSAIRGDEFLTILSTFTTTPPMVERFTSGVAELAAILATIDAEMRDGQPARLKFAEANTNIVRSAHGTVDALSPSTAERLDALNEYKKLMDEQAASSTRGLLRSTTPNNCAIALWVELFGQKTILGSDLEEKGNINRGWSAVCNLSPQPMNVAKIHKIPHHGSETAHHQPVWDNHIDRQTALSIVTPYTRGVKKLPSAEDVARLKELSVNVFCTSDPSTDTKVKERPSKVERLARSTAKEKVVLDTKLGMIRTRGPGAALVSTFGASLAL